MSTPVVLFVNLRRTPHEGRAALLAARRLGYDVVLLADKVPDYAKGLVAAVETTDTYDLDKGLAAARTLADRYPVKGVVTWADRDVELVAHIGQKLGLPSPTPAAAHLARNKYAMKHALAHIPGVVPRHCKVRTIDELEKAVAEIGFPAVIKPTGASGSKGIFELRTQADLRPALEALQGIARPDLDPIFRYYGAEFIVEEFLEGPEFSVEGWVSDGRVFVAGITDKWTTDPFHLEYQHVHPSCQPTAVQQEITARTALVVSTLGLNHCAFHLECKYTSRGFRLIEVAARIGGDYITSHLVPMSTGIDFYSQVIRVVTNQRPVVEPQSRVPAHAGVRFLLGESEGKLAGLNGIESMLGLPAVEHLFLEMAPGASVLLPPRSFAAQRAAAVIARHTDYDTVVASLQEAGQRCTLTLAP